MTRDQIDDKYEKWYREYRDSMKSLGFVHTQPSAYDGFIAAFKLMNQIDNTNPTVMEKMDKYLKDKESVSLYYNDEIGYFVWSVTVDSDPEFWLDSFVEKEDAVKYCEKHGLTIAGERK